MRPSRSIFVVGVRSTTMTGGAILRSPLSGGIKTFVSDGVLSQPINTLVTQANQLASKMLCVAAPQGTFVGRQVGVRIDSFASNQGAISIPLETDGLCG